MAIVDDVKLFEDELMNDAEDCVDELIYLFKKNHGKLYSWNRNDFGLRVSVREEWALQWLNSIDAVVRIIQFIELFGMSWYVMEFYQHCFK